MGKFTKRNAMEMIINAIETNDFSALTNNTDVLEACKKVISSTDRRNEASKVRNAKKNADKLDAIKNALTSEFQTRDEIADKTGFTAQTVSANMTKLVNAGICVKEEIKIEKNKKMAYKLA